MSVDFFVTTPVADLKATYNATSAAGRVQPHNQTLHQVQKELVNLLTDIATNYQAIVTVTADIRHLSAQVYDDIPPAPAPETFGATHESETSTPPLPTTQDYVLRNQLLQALVTIDQCVPDESPVQRLREVIVRTKSLTQVADRNLLDPLSSVEAFTQSMLIKYASCEDSAADVLIYALKAREAALKKLFSLESMPRPKTPIESPEDCYEACLLDALYKAKCVLAIESFDAILTLYKDPDGFKEYLKELSGRAIPMVARSTCQCHLYKATNDTATRAVLPTANTTERPLFKRDGIIHTCDFSCLRGATVLLDDDYQQTLDAARARIKAILKEGFSYQMPHLTFKMIDDSTCWLAILVSEWAKRRAHFDHHVELDGRNLTAIRMAIDLFAGNDSLLLDCMMACQTESREDSWLRPSSLAVQDATVLDCLTGSETNAVEFQVSQAAEDFLAYYDTFTPTPAAAFKEYSSRWSSLFIQWREVTSSDSHDPFIVDQIRPSVAEVFQMLVSWFGTELNVSSSVPLSDALFLFGIVAVCAQPLSNASPDLKAFGKRLVEETPALLMDEQTFGYLASEILEGLKDRLTNINEAIVKTIQLRDVDLRLEEYGWSAENVKWLYTLAVQAYFPLLRLPEETYGQPKEVDYIAEWVAILRHAFITDACDRLEAAPEHKDQKASCLAFLRALTLAPLAVNSYFVGSVLRRSELCRLELCESNIGGTEGVMDIREHGDALLRESRTLWFPFVGKDERGRASVVAGRPRVELPENRELPFFNTIPLLDEGEMSGGVAEMESRPGMWEGGASNESAVSRPAFSLSGLFGSRPASVFLNQFRNWGDQPGSQ